MRLSFGFFIDTRKKLRDGGIHASLAAEPPSEAREFCDMPKLQTTALARYFRQLHRLRTAQ